jgi:hypothetical protein
MGKHGHGSRWYGGTRGRRGGRDRRLMNDPGYFDPAPRLPTKLPLGVVLVGLAV